MQEETQKYQNCYVVAITLFLVATFVTAIQYKTPTIMEPLSQMFQVSASAITWLMSIFTFVGIVFSLPIGAIVKKFGPKLVIIAAVILDVLASVIGAFTGSFVVLLITRACEGLALVSVIACCPIVIQKCVRPEKNGTASGIYMLGGMLGATFGGIMTPTLFQMGGFKLLWLGYAVLIAISGLIFAFVIKVPAEEAKSEKGELVSGNIAAACDDVVFEEKNKAICKESNIKIFVKPNTLIFLVPFAAFQVMLLGVLTYAPASMQQQGMSATLSGLISTLPMLLAILSSTAFGVIIDKTKRCKPLLLIGLLAMAVTTPILLTQTGITLWIAVVVMGLLAMGVPTAFITAYPQILGDPKMLSVGMGVFMFVQSIGQFLGSSIPSMLLGPALTNWLLCGLVLAGAGIVAAICIIVCKFK